MRVFVLSDNRQSADGMRLCGCGVRLLDPAEDPLPVLDDLLAAGEYGVILLTHKLYAAHEAAIAARAADFPHILIAEIPDRHGGEQTVVPPRPEEEEPF